VLNEKRSSSIFEILRELLVSNQIDVRVAGVFSTFLLEGMDEMFGERVVSNFISDIASLSPLGFFDNFLMVLRLFSLALLRKDFTYIDKFLETFATADPRIRKFSAMAYACLSSMKEDYDFLSEFNNRDEDTQWGFIIGLGLKERLVEMVKISKTANLADELLLGLLLLDIGKIDESIPLLLASGGLAAVEDRAKDKPVEAG
ncbi:MAG: hypothetical protein ACFFD4_37340, partial [Candidatus Odinarchaeota archaeon]